MKKKNLINYFFFFLKIFNLIKFFFNLFDYFIFNINEEKSNNTENFSSYFNKKYLIKLIFNGTFPLRQICYLFISYKISEKMLDDPNLNTFLSIVTVIEIIDKSIVNIINEEEEEEKIIEKKVDNINEVDNEKKEN